jgi:hypothetical protein
VGSLTGKKAPPCVRGNAALCDAVSDAYADAPHVVSAFRPATFHPT